MKGTSLTTLTARSPAHSTIELSCISIDGGTQARDHLDQGVINDYASAIDAGAAFPSIIVFYDGEKYWLADGFHRFHAFAKLGRMHIDADVRQGTRRDAILHSVGANEEHGLRRTNDDKRRAVQTLLNDSEWSAWSDRDIARQCRVGAPFVAKCRSLTVTDYSERKYTTRHGTVAIMQTEKIGAPGVPRKSGHSQVRRVPDLEFRDSDFQAEAEAAARDLEIERDERIALSGSGELADENEQLKKQIAMLDRRIAALHRDNESLKFREKMWRERALSAGWKGRDDA
jgi:hypothetical protein